MRIKKGTSFTVLSVLALACLVAAAPSARAQGDGGTLRERLKERIEERREGGGREGIGSRLGALRDMKKPAELPPGARLLADVHYGPDEKQGLDVYIPAGAANAPLIVMVHGGAWFIGDKAHNPLTENKVGHWLPGGFIFISVNYRLVPDVTPREQAQDVAAALRLIRDSATEWGGDPSRLVLMGHSAGAHLVALLGAAPESWGLAPWKGTVVLDSAVMDVPAVMERKHFGFYDRAFGADPAFWREVSPLHRLAGDATPMLVVCSEQRKDKPCRQSEDFVRALVEKKVYGKLSPVDMSHAEINGDLGLPGAYTETIDRFVASVI